MTIKLTEEAKQAATETLPGYMLQPLFDYFEKGWQPGGFLRAVLENDLLEAYGHADATNKNYIGNYISWLYWHVPGRPEGGWGSPAAVNKWLEEARLEDTIES